MTSKLVQWLSGAFGLAAATVAQAQTVLTAGVPVANLSGTVGSSQNFTLQVPPGNDQVRFRISGGTGNAQLAVRFGSAPTVAAADCRPYAQDNLELCILEAAAGTWFATLTASADYAGVTLVADLGTFETNLETVTSIAGAAGSDQRFYFEMPADKDRVQFWSSADGDPADALWGYEPPTRENFNYWCSLSTSYTCPEYYFAQASPGDRFHFLVHGVNAFSNVTIGWDLVDTIPDPFDFVDQVNVPPDTVIYSNEQVITGHDGPWEYDDYNEILPNVYVSGGEVVIDGQNPPYYEDWRLYDGSTLQLKARSGPNVGDQVVITAYVNDTSDTFRITTGDIVPDSFGFAPQTHVPLSSTRTTEPATITGLTLAAPVTITNGSYSVGCTGTFVTTKGTISNGQTLCLRRNAPSSADSTAVVAVKVGPTTVNWTITTAPDNTPAAFSFPAKANVQANTLIVSNTVTITGISANIPIGITGGAYSAGCTGSFRDTPSTISNNQTVCVRVKSSTASSTSSSATLTIGTGSATFTVTTADTVPGAFAFNPQTEVPAGSVRTSNTQTIGGITGPSTVTINNSGSYSVGCTGTFVTTAGTIGNGQTICLRRTAPTGPGATAVVTLSIGGVSANWSITSAHDKTPNAFSFGAQTNLPPSSLRTSNTVTIAGVTTAIPISIANGAYSIGCNGTFVTTVGTIANNQTVCLQRASSPSGSATVTVTLNAGTATVPWNLTTADDKTPNAFSFGAQTGVPANSLRTSNTVTISGITAPATISVSSNGAYSIGCNGTFQTTASTIANNQSVCLRRTSSGSAGATVTTTLTVGTAAVPWSITTAP